MVLEELEDGWKLSPMRPGQQEADLVLGKSYMRADIPGMFGLVAKGRTWEQGFVPQEKQVFLFVTLDKSTLPDEHKYEDRFLSPSRFEWKSQRKTAQHHKHGRIIRGHRELGMDVLVFVRKHGKLEGKAAPFIYCGKLDFVSWEGNKPITVQWDLHAPLTDQQFAYFTEGL